MAEAGKDATEAFEDVGHSDEARAMLADMLVGDFEGSVGVNTSSIRFYYYLLTLRLIFQKAVPSNTSSSTSAPASPPSSTNRSVPLSNDKRNMTKMGL